MAQSEHMQGVVIRVRREGDVKLTLLTPEYGKVYVIAKGAKSLRGPQMPLSQLFAYGDFELYRRGDFYWLNTGELIQSFRGLGADLDALNLASYFCEVAATVSDVGVPARELVRLLLADGKRRSVSRPKRKKPGHVMPLTNHLRQFDHPTLRKLKRGEPVSDRELRRALAAFKEEGMTLGERRYD